ncbi:uncharacterized protein LOC128193539 isoform X2 [Vigna angularis]|uniref:uncharacterized protein LOC128193539 isoform X2 n=1 Tax=Phaseolus angularis TaxID=3914 RepID=UPI0022B35D20|nr:uncharacterized protein LOC128193539 isoform X2 [Vigna angularis]
MSASDSGSGKSRRGRGVTRVADVTSGRVDGQRRHVDIDPRSGHPSGPNADRFRSYLGKLAKSHVSILHACWDDVPEVDKNLLWQDVQQHFDIPNTLQIRKKVLSHIAIRFRDFKTRLTRLYVFGDRQHENPSQHYTFTEEDWMQFRASRESEEWKDKRLAAQERQRLNDTPHLLSRGGYAKLEKKLRKSRADALGLESPDLAPAPARYELWKAARTKSDGNMTSSSAALISQRIDELVEQQTQGTFAGQGRDDILTTAIGRPEHPGRVRGVPGAIGLRDYFGPTQKTPQSMSQETLRQMDLQWEERLNQSMRSMEQRFMEQLQEQKQIQRALEEKLHSMTQGHMGADETPTAPRVSTRGSCSAVEPNEYSGQYELLVDGDPPRIVAVGRVLEGGETIHGVPILPQHVRVTIDEVRDPQAQVPVPTPEINFVGEAIGTFIAWPRALIMSHIATPQFTRPQKQPIHDTVIHEDDDMAEAEDDPISKLVTKLPRLKKASLQLYWDLRVFGLPPHVPVYITFSDALEVIEGDRMLNISIIQLWCM